MQTMQQRRAKYALECVLKHASDLPKKQQKEYRSYASALPAMIHMNGLGQAAAFFKSKGGTHELLYSLLSKWLTQDDQPLSGSRDLLDGITNKNMYNYQLAQAEAQMLMSWVKKFGKAYMHEDTEGNQL